MKVTAFVGSPRPGGNTEVLVREALQGAEDAGAETALVYLNDAAFLDCQGCGFCNESGECKLEDDMAGLYPMIEEADGIILGSPVYFGMVSGITKSFIDRWYAFMGPEFSSRLRPGKKAAIILAQGDPNADVYGPMATHLAVTLEFFGIEVAAPLVGAGLIDIGDAAKNKELMQRAYELGRRLVSG